MTTDSNPRTTWIEMINGGRLAAIPFVAFVNAGKGREFRFDFKAANPPMYAGDPNLFSRLSFETIRGQFATWGFQVGHIIRGECTESGVRDCYVYNRDNHVPFAVIRPLVFTR
jgi:hypothetical protein